MDARERIWRERGLREAVLAGDEGAWRQWYDESCPDLFAYVLWRCGNLRDHAEEVLQETWLAAVRRLPSFDPAAGSFAGWLRGIAVNVLRNRARASRRTVLPWRGEVENEEPGAELMRWEQAEQIAWALAALPEHYEAVLRERYLEGRSVPEIAAGRGESVKAVESLLTRARRAFRANYPYDERPDE